MSVPGKRTLLSGRSSLGPILLCAILAALPANAHLLNMSRVDIQLVDNQLVEITAHVDMTRAFGSSDAYFAASQVESPESDATIMTQLRQAADAIELSVGNQRVDLSPVSITFSDHSLSGYRSPVEWPRATLRFSGTLDSSDRPQHEGVQVRYTDAFVFEEPIATTLNSLVDERTVSRWLVTFQKSPVLSAPLWIAAGKLAATPPEQNEPEAAFRRYFALGFWHILPAGVDHLLFVLALVIGATSVSRLIVTLSLYTLAHSITFAGSALGWLPASIPGVEPLIVLSILWAAFANLSRPGFHLQHITLTFAFGLLHGLGFAGALSEAGLPINERLISLLGFNVGVEGAQILTVVLLGLPIWWLRRFDWYNARILRPASAAIAFVALFWLTTMILPTR